MGFGGLSLALLVLTIFGFVTLVGEIVVMVSLLDLLSLFRYPPKSGRALLSGTLPFRYCAARSAHSTPTWRLPVSGHVDRLIAAHSDAAGDCGSEVVRVHPGSGSRAVRKRFRLNRKNPAHLAGVLIHSRPRVWKRLRHDGFSGLSMPDHSRRRCDHAVGALCKSMTGLGLGNFLGNVQAHVSRFARLFN